MKKTWQKNMTDEEIRERDNLQYYAQKHRGDRCEACGVTKKDARLEVHHKDENWRNNDPSNLQTLCKSCHIRWHMSGSFTQIICKVEGCERPHKGHGFCELHLDHIKATGSTEKRPPKPRLPCKVCGKPFEPLRSRGDLCNVHRKVKERYGDPFAKQVGRGGSIPK